MGQTLTREDVFEYVNRGIVTIGATIAVIGGMISDIPVVIVGVVIFGLGCILELLLLGGVFGRCLNPVDDQSASFINTGTTGFKNLRY